MSIANRCCFSIFAFQFLPFNLRKWGKSAEGLSYNIFEKLKRNWRFVTKGATLSEKNVSGNFRRIAVLFCLTGPTCKTIFYTLYEWCVILLRAGPKNWWTRNIQYIQFSPMLSSTDYSSKVCKRKHIVVRSRETRSWKGCGTNIKRRMK